MIVDEEAYLEHFGIPGMRWGVRKQSQPGFHLTKKQKIAGVAAGTAIAAGAVITASFMKQYGGQTIADMASRPFKFVGGKSSTIAGDKIYPSVLNAVIKRGG